MLSCKQVTEQTSAYVDGDMSRKQRLELRLHLLMCRSCRRFIQYFELSRSQISSKLAKPADDVEVKRVMQAIEHDRKHTH